MHIEQFRNYCLAKKAVTEEFPFDNTTLVFKVCGKMFCLTNIDLFESINLKCNPEKVIEFRENHPEVIPGYHMNKKHWNTVSTKGQLPDNLLEKWINDSYNLVVTTLTKKQKEELL